MRCDHDQVDVTIAHIRALLTVAEHGNFTRAAEALHLSQSGVSRTIAAFERRLGAPLLHRGAEGAELTALGRTVAGHGETVLHGLRAIQELRADADEPPLRAGAVASAHPRLLPAALTELRRRSPRREILAVRGEDDELAEWLAADTIDLAISTVPIGPEPRIITDRFLAAVPENHPLAACSGIPAVRLESAGIADPGGTCGPLLAAWFAEGGAHWHPEHTVRDIPTVLTMVAAGITAAIVPALAVPGQLPDGIALRPLLPPLHRKLYIQCRPRAAELAGLLAGAADS